MHVVQRVNIWGFAQVREQRLAQRKHLLLGSLKREKAACMPVFDNVRPSRSTVRAEQADDSIHDEKGT